jgi:hypothetical protein
MPQLVCAASTVQPPWVGDAGNGYPASSWKLLTVGSPLGGSAAGKSSRGSEGRKPHAWELGVLRVLVDNKSVAETGERHHLWVVSGTSVSSVVQGSGCREVQCPDKAGQEAAVKVVLQLRTTWRIVVCS